MQNLINLFVFILFLIPINVSSQSHFYKIYTNNGYDFGQGIVQLEDSSYVITGSSSSFQEASSQAFLLKVDSLGNYKWSSNYGGAESDFGRRVLYKKNVGFFIAGYTNSFGKGDFNAYLVKTDEQGKLLWQKSYGGNGWEKINDAIILPDTSIIMVGQTNSGTSGNDNIYIIRTDKNGDTLWTKNIGGSSNGFATVVKDLNGTDVLIGGQIYVSDSIKNKAYLLSLNKNGQVNWEHYYGNDGDYQINDLIISGNEINVVGCRKNKVKNDSDGYSAKINVSGALIYEFAYSIPGLESYESISNYRNVNKVYIAYNQELAGTTYPIGKDLYFGRFRTDLVYDNHTIGLSNSGDDISGQIISTLDGGLILVGYNSSFGAGGNNVFLCKISSDEIFPITSGVPIPNSLVSIEKIEAEIDFSVYPNPASDKICINVKYDFEGKIEIKDMLGRVIYQKEINSINEPDTEKNNEMKSLQNNDYQEVILLNEYGFENGNYFVVFEPKNKVAIIKRFLVNK